MIQKYKLYNKLLRIRILLFVPLILISFNSISQTTDTSKVVIIPYAKATRIAQDLTAYGFLRQADSIRKDNINQYKKQIQLDSLTSSLLNQKIQIQSEIIGSLNSKDSVQQQITDLYKKKSNEYKWGFFGVCAVFVVKFIFIK